MGARKRRNAGRPARKNAATPLETPHDRYFAAIFSQPEHAEGELRHALPPRITRRIKWSTLRLVQERLVDERLSERRGDLIYEVEYDGPTRVLYLPLEHQSSSDAAMPMCLASRETRLSWPS
jgi:predicted transposase YdaD